MTHACLFGDLDGPQMLLYAAPRPLYGVRADEQQSLSSRKGCFQPGGVIKIALAHPHTLLGQARQLLQCARHCDDLARITLHQQFHYAASQFTGGAGYNQGVLSLVLHQKGGFL